MHSVEAFKARFYTTFCKIQYNKIDKVLSYNLYV